MGIYLTRRQLMGHGLTFGTAAIAGIPICGSSAQASSLSASASYSTPQLGEEWPNPAGYRIYNPTVTTSLVVDTYDNGSRLRYAENTSMAMYGGKLWAIMDGSVTGYMEGAPDQQIWMTTSDDNGETWTDPFQPFRDSSYCSNPISESAMDWQPSLVVFHNELWATWSNSNCYISKLTKPGDKWTNYRFEFVGEQPFISNTVIGNPAQGRSLSPTVDGISDWRPFPSGDPTVLTCGVLLCPGTIYSTGHYTGQIAGPNGFMRALKYNMVLKTINGTDWSMRRIDNGDFGDYTAWEPYVVESSAGDVLLFSRNLSWNAAPDDAQLVARSLDRGETFTPPASTKMLVARSRGSAKQVSPRRWFMVHCDSSGRSRDAGGNDRVHGSLFVSRSGDDDFVPGVQFCDFDANVKYPQFIVVDDAAYINYTSGYAASNASGNGRYAYRLTKVSPLPRDDVAYVHPRSLNLFSGTSTDPTLVSATPPYYLLNGFSDRIVSTSTVTPSDGLTYTTWIYNSHDPPVEAALIDTRSGLSGSLFRVNGTAISSLDVLHGFDLPLNTPIFTASVISNLAQTVTAYAAYGQRDFLTKISYFQSILFTGQPSNNETITVGGTTYRFKNTVSNSQDVTIGAALPLTVANLKLAVNNQLGTNNSASNLILDTRLIVTRPDGASFTVSTDSSNIKVESSVSLSSGVAYFGATEPTSIVPSYHGRLYDARIYDAALTAGNMRDLYNERGAEFGYSAINGTSSPPSSPLLRVDPANPDAVAFPSVGKAARCEVLSDSLLRIYGEGSAAVEIPYESTQLTIPYKLGRAPGKSDQYVIATFGSSDNPVRLFIKADQPNGLYLNGTRLGTVNDPTTWNTATVLVSAGKVTAGDATHTFSGGARCFLGNAFRQFLLTADDYIDFEVSEMQCSQA